MFKHNLKATINLQRPDKDGRCAIRIRSTINRKVSYYPTGITLLPKYWDGKVILHPNRNLLNSSIAYKISELEKDFITQNLAGDKTPKVKVKDISFKDYANSLIKRSAKVETPDTTKHKKSYLKKFLKFKDIKISQITPTLLREYEDYCRAAGNQENTVWSSVKYIKSVIFHAINDKMLDNNPMSGYVPVKYINPARDWLTAEEILKVEEVAENGPKGYKDAANWFMFQCYTGLRYGDCFEFRKSKVINGRIILRTEKTGTDVSIKVHPKLSKVIERINKPLTSNQDYNRNLKAIAAICKIDKPLTSHIARHSFAVNWLTNGGSMEVLSKVLGHADMKITQLYGKIINRKIDDEIDLVFE